MQNPKSWGQQLAMNDSGLRSFTDGQGKGGSTAAGKGGQTRKSCLWHCQCVCLNCLLELASLRWQAGPPENFVMLMLQLYGLKVMASAGTWQRRAELVPVWHVVTW